MDVPSTAVRSRASASQRAMAELRAETAELLDEMAEVRDEIVELGAEIRDEVAELGHELRGEMAELSSGLRREIAQVRNGLASAISARFGKHNGRMVGLFYNAVALIGAVVAIVVLFVL